jgi:glycosyltransferase involved in cell wall biosynthesis
MLDAKLSLVLPAHNESENIEAVVDRALEVLPTVTRDFEIIVVDDGSHDETPQIVDRLAANHPSIVARHHEVNRGYGSALTTGFDAATGDYIMFMDADRQFDIADIRALLPYVTHYDIVAGYRIKRRDPLYRRLYGKMFGMSVWVLFGVHMRDIDCAFKIYRADLLKGITLTTPGALINTEMLARSKRRGATIAEVGVNHYPRLAGESSGGSPKVVLRAMRETIRLWGRLRSEPAVDAEDNAVPASPAGFRVKAFAPALVLVGIVVLAVLVRRRRGG